MKTLPFNKKETGLIIEICKNHLIEMIVYKNGTAKENDGCFKINKFKNFIEVGCYDGEELTEFYRSKTLLGLKRILMKMFRFV